MARPRGAGAVVFPRNDAAFRAPPPWPASRSARPGATPAPRADVALSARGRPLAWPLPAAQDAAEQVKHDEPARRIARADRGGGPRAAIDPASFPAGAG